MKNKVKRLDGKGKLITLTKKLEIDMRSFCRDKGIESESELVRQAIAKYIYSDYEDETLKLQGIKNTNDQIIEIKDMLNILFSYLRYFHINTLAYHVDIDPEYADAAFLSATNRHEKVFNAFQNSLKNDPPFFERILHKFYSEDNNEQS